jgi:hypothetical protein
MAIDKLNIIEKFPTKESRNVLRDTLDRKDTPLPKHTNVKQWTNMYNCCKNNFY